MLDSEKKKKEIIAARRLAVRQSASQSFDELLKIVSQFRDLDKSIDNILRNTDKLNRKIKSSSIEDMFLGRRIRLQDKMKILSVAKGHLKTASGSLLRVHMTQEQILDELESLDVSI